MSFDFPGANTSFENHNVSEESFWPSFTDIMMVIVMTFLLITVSVIINNYHLVETLKKTMQAEQLASSIAEDVQVENTSLEERLKQFKQQLAALNIQLSSAKKEAEKSRSALRESQQNIEKLNAVATKNQQQLDDKNQQITTLSRQQQESLDALDEAKNRVLQLQTEKSNNEDKLSGLQKEMALLQTTLQEKSSQSTALQATLDKTSTQLANLKKLRESEETKLLSLQGELDSLDKKYQKLLRPARSAKGKFVVSVMYSKRGGRSRYRLRSSPKGEYADVSRKQLVRKLKKLKKKYTTDLYVKIIIPEKSGLSYNEAWRFTNEMQKSYDYYYQDEEK
ncbi:MAG: hypothetical protein DSZ29_04725 [Aquificaceae bacterium]|nr:MAG: hypothetical protein DSZ29_04725 [Aquificaceae bacterium]